MIKVYLKRPVCVERIDELGTGLLDKYEIYSLSGGIWHPHDEVGHSMLCSGYLEWGDWIATGADSSHWIIQNALYEQQYGELPVIPKEVADWIEKCKNDGTSVGDMLCSERRPEKMRDWMALTPGTYEFNQRRYKEHQELVARAWLDGYQVEEDK
ncbi:DUF1642 domain-containing protein [Lactiplantibacillus xiangfangensis]|uniref:DUF1642 domain-containing protein n=1 Tax=Lactiplantibacillus xiangfangensis TaxID=942150 RepID=UPI003850A9A7